MKVDFTQWLVIFSHFLFYDQERKPRNYAAEEMKNAALS